MKIVGAILGFIIGAAFEDFSAALAGALIGFLVVLVVQELRKPRGATTAPPAASPGNLRQRVVALEARVSELELQIVALKFGAAASAPETRVEQTQHPVEPVPVAPAQSEPPVPIAAANEPPSEQLAAVATASAVDATVQPAASADERPASPRAPNPIWAFLTGGNAPVRIGLIVLFFGVAFLLKYVAERITVPIELRLAGVAAGGIAMLVLGWKLRAKREAYGLALEGGAVGVLYLTVFFAFRTYALLPPVLAFALLAGIAFFSAVLAMRQDALSLALTGVIGGFLAPLLASTGQGSHVMLFSYFAVLDAGILYVAWHKAWRMLNLVGFGFTVLIAAAWGAERWEPALFGSTEPFLIFFFLLFVAIAVLYALRQSIELRHYVDGTLVFGTPIVAFGMQSQMVRHIEFGAALSALVLSGFYLILARCLHGRKNESVRLLVEAFLALGVVFATLAIPLALDGRWTSAAWALEGAAVYWAGLRQQRKLARAFGLLLQPLAAVALIHGWIDQPDAIAVLNSGCLGCIIMALSDWFISYRMARPGADVTTLETKTAVYVFSWAWLWWLGGGLLEIDRLYSGVVERDVERVFVALWLVALSIIGTKLDWRTMRLSTLAAPVLLAIQAIGVAMTATHPFTGFGYGTWPIAFAASYWLLARHEQEASASIVRALHVGLAWIVLALGTWELDWQLGRAGSGAWRYIAWAILPAVALHLAAILRLSQFWPMACWEATYRIAACAPVAALLWLWGMAMGMLAEGSAHPLPYIPVLNPVDLAIAAIALGLLRWTLALEQRSWLARLRLTMRNAYALLGVLIFAWFNGTLLRTIHHYAGVPHRYDALMESLLVQAALSLFWSILGVTLMTIAARIARRALWFVGVALMGAVVVKLFLVDLSGVGTVERIVSFIGVGLLLMLVGYVAPMPPAEVRRIEASDA